MLDWTAEGGCPHPNDLSFFPFVHLVHRRGKVYQVIGRDVLRVADECANGGAKLRDRVFQLCSFGYCY